MTLWQIVVQAEDGSRAMVGAPLTDLVAITKRALALADELGRLPPSEPRDCHVDLVAADGRVELAIAIIAGGLDPHGERRGS